MITRSRASLGNGRGPDSEESSNSDRNSEEELNKKYSNRLEKRDHSFEDSTGGSDLSSSCSPFRSLQAELDSFKSSPESVKTTRSRKSHLDDSLDTEPFDHSRHLSRQELQVSKDRKRESPPNRSPEFGIILALAVILLIVLFVGYTTLKPSNETNVVHFAGDNDIPQRLLLFDKDVKRLHSHFPNQSLHLWKTVKASIKSVLKTERPEKPAVLFLAGIGIDNKKLIDCLSSHIGKSVTNAYRASQHIEITDSQLLAVDEDHAKLLLDQQLKLAFESGVKVAILRGIENYPANVLLMLHSYCDNFNAPFKDVTFVLNYGVFSNLNTNILDIEETLKEKWGEKLNDVNEAGALLSRLANNIVLLRQESTEILHKHC
ncbi:torsin-1A-interacting protein 2-like isoform X2 [Tubulanus polymorphus]|uniref:torsin-1A-interacting protein 2-like isoform X2 n=1 Tax=Tubulanus polymorphus TaxID=672921 RepID=UPI003DA2C862